MPKGITHIEKLFPTNLFPIYAFVGKCFTEVVVRQHLLQSLIMIGCLGKYYLVALWLKKVDHKLNKTTSLSTLTEGHCDIL